MDQNGKGWKDVADKLATHTKGVTIRTSDGENHRFEGGKIHYDLTYPDTLVVTSAAGQSVFDVASIMLVVLAAN
jgi:hypothetical protein